MKNFRLQTILFALAFVTLFAACKKDDDKKPATVSQKILGKWSINKSTVKVYVNNELFTTIEETGKAGDYVEFNSNKTYVSSTEDEGVESGTYEILNETAMTITIDGEKNTVSIDKLDNKDFKFTKTYSETVDGDVIKGVGTFELSK